MKKILTAGAGILAILAITYYSSLSSGIAKGSNDSDDYEYEYYYTESDGQKDGNMSDSVNNNNDNINAANDDSLTAADEYTLPKTIDTEPDSVTVLINKEYSLPSSYIPNNLVIPEISFYGTGCEEKRYMREDAAKALELMFNDAVLDGKYLYGISGYRSYTRQSEIYNKNVRLRGSAATNKVSAVPGHSEHQTGLAIDISCKQLIGSLSERFAQTEEGIWVQENCYKYGYIIRYPKDKESITGYSYEPWHIRYVGKDVAGYLHDKDITLEEYYNYVPSMDISDNIISDAATAETVSSYSKPTATKAPKNKKPKKDKDESDGKTDYDDEADSNTAANAADRPEDDAGISDTGPENSTSNSNQTIPDDIRDADENGPAAAIVTPEPAADTSSDIPIDLPEDTAIELPEE